MPEQDVPIEPGSRGKLRYDKERKTIVGDRLKYGALIDRLRKRAALANEINEFGLESDLLDAAAALGELKV